MLLYSNDKCSLCQSNLACDDAASWSMDFPSFLNLDRTKHCHKCLILSMGGEIKKYLQDLTPDKIKTVQALGKPSKFIEGIDYNLNAQGSWVFSQWYLLRQGYCCGNGCTNCPYHSITS